MDESSTVSMTMESDVPYIERQEEEKQCSVAFMKVSNFLADAPYDNRGTSNTSQSL